MTKELVISVIIVVVIIAGDIFTTKYTNKSIEIATQSLSEIRKEMEKENEEDINKDKLKEQINLYGGKTIDSVSKNTDVVIVGDNPGSKYEKAKELGITIWNEEKLKEELNKINM